MSTVSVSSGDFFLNSQIWEKERRLVQAVEENNVDLLKILLDSPKWYNTRGEKSCNLLQIAILKKNKEVFDYLLSLPDYPLEFKNFTEGTTALEMINDCFSLYLDVGDINEYFPCELIKKGACIDNRFYSGYTLLHGACKKGFVKTSMLLIEKGIDVNVCRFREYENYTPLQMMCIDHRWNCTEIILMLLEFGADPSVRDYNGYTPFENSVRYSYPNETQEALFYYTYDEFSLLEIHFDILFKLAARNSSLFYEIIKLQFKIIEETNESTYISFFNELKYIELTNLKTLITKFETSYQFFFAQVFANRFDIRIDRVFIEKLNILIESGLKDQIINNFLPLLRRRLHNDIRIHPDYSVLTEYICFLLSYGMELDEDCLCNIYKQFGYCDLFKILLHMDIKKETYDSSCILPNLLINVNQTLEDILKNNENMLYYQLEELMSYFVHPKLHSMYREEMPGRRINVPQVPSLLELSRNVFRSYFINKFEIKSSRTFYTLLNCLKISPVHKRMITYETKLYSP